MLWSTIIYGTAILTNAVFSNCAPNFYREIDRYHLPVSHPFQSNEVSRFAYHLDDEQYCLDLRSGLRLELRYRRLTSFESPAHHPRRGPYGPVEKPKISYKQALQVARDFVALCEMPKNETWIDTKPRSDKPNPGEPWYDFEWFEPKEEDSATVRVAVDCQSGSVIYASFWCLSGRLINEHHPAKPVDEDYQPPGTTNEPPPLALERKLVTDMAGELKRWAPRLGLTPQLAEEEQVRKHLGKWRRIFGLHGAPDYWIVSLRAEGWELGFRDGGLFVWRAPDAFFGAETPPDLDRLKGAWRLTQAQAIKLAREAVHDLRFQHPDLKVVDRPPEVQKPNLRGLTVPRYLFEWVGTTPLPSGYRYMSSNISLEVDAQSGKLKSLTVYVWEEGDEKILVK